MDYFKPCEFKLIQGKDELSVYRWGDQDVNHYFCSVCGVYPFHDTQQKPGHYRINMACIDGLELNQLAISWFDGKSR